MTGWSEEMHAIHDEIQDRIAFRPPEVNARNPDDILVTHVKIARPKPPLKADRPVRFRQCCLTPKTEWHTPKCFNNPRNWRRK